MSGVRGALKRASEVAGLSQESLARKRFEQRGGRPRVLTDEDYELAAAAARTRPRAATKTAAAKLHKLGRGVAPSTLRRYLHQRGFKQRPAVDYDPMTTQARNRGGLPAPP